MHTSMKPFLTFQTQIYSGAATLKKLINKK